MRVPYYVRCPGCLSGVILEQPVSHVDIAATLLEFAGVPIPEYLDGRSFKPLLLPASTKAAQAQWDPVVFIQYFGESFTGGVDEDFHEGCGNGINAQSVRSHSKEAQTASFCRCHNPSPLPQP